MAYVQRCRQEPAPRTPVRARRRREREPLLERDPRVRDDPRVDVRERTNARELVAADFEVPIDLVVVDASFIGIEKLLPAIAGVMRSGGDLVALVKPQFEAGREVVSKGKGVVRDAGARATAIAGARQAIAVHGFDVLGEVDSAVHGPKGNVERFVHARRR